MRWPGTADSFAGKVSERALGQAEARRFLVAFIVISTAPNGFLRMVGDEAALLQAAARGDLLRYAAGCAAVSVQASGRGLADRDHPSTRPHACRLASAPPSPAAAVASLWGEARCPRRLRCYVSCPPPSPHRAGLGSRCARARGLV